ncbi:MAG TPA: thioredoxin fold domain-containing protein, partial [Chitinophagales bacterium]|nr:thioredoxin fold domain-containing protein [Chitinophagales bacterium]
MKKQFFFNQYLLPLLLFCTGLLIFSPSCGNKTANNQNAQNSTATKNKANQQNTNNTATQHEGLINWVSFEEVEKLVKENPKPVLIDIYTDWCGWCKKLDKNTFNYPAIAEYVNKNFYAVKFNAEMAGDLQFNGRTYPPVPGGRKPTNSYAKLLILGNQPSGRMGYPSIAFLNEKLERINAFPGYKSPAQFDALLNFIKNDEYKKTTYNVYAANFKSAIPADADKAPPPAQPLNKPPTRQMQQQTLPPNVKIQENKQGLPQKNVKVQVPPVQRNANNNS